MDNFSTGFKIKTAANLLKRQINNAVLKSGDMTALHCWIIGCLYESRDGLFQRDIEQKFNIRRSTATQILKVMEKNGLISKERVSRDRRLKKLLLTPKAVKMHEAALEEIRAIEARMLSGISAGELEVFDRVLGKIVHNLQG